jgi:hypothetical protein
LLDVPRRSWRVDLEYILNAGGLPCPGVEPPGGRHTHPDDLDVQRRRLSVRVVQNASRDRKMQQVGTSEVRPHTHTVRRPNVWKANAVRTFENQAALTRPFSDGTGIDLLSVRFAMV